MDDLKIKVAEAALSYIEDETIIGVGTGSTITCFIDALAKIKHRLDACVPSSKTTASQLREKGIPIMELNVAGSPAVYFDGADEVTSWRDMIKGGGGALTQEKIIATASKKFICLVDESKLVGHLGNFPVAVEVLPMARSFVARELVKLGGDPQYREGFITDNGNIILDTFYLDLSSPKAIEDAINNIPGVVENGIFSRRPADLVLVSSKEGVRHF